MMRTLVTCAIKPLCIGCDSDGPRKLHTRWLRHGGIKWRVRFAVCHECWSDKQRVQLALRAAFMRLLADKQRFP